MKRSFIIAMLCLHGLFCSISAQNLSNLYSKSLRNYTPVEFVDATEIDDSSVQVVWSFEKKDDSTENFETGDFSSHAWNNSVSDYPWEITTDAYEGQYAMKSTCENVNYGISAIEIEYTAPSDGYLGFYYKISSEQYYDYGYFYVDGVLVAEMSGVADWIYKQLNISEGKHTYRWEYSKDELWNEGDDAFYIDDITFFKKESFEGGWLHYDDGTVSNLIGWGEPSPVYWAASFPPSEETEGYTLTKVALFDYEGNAANFRVDIHLGGETAPGTLVTSQDFGMPGNTNAIYEVALDEPVYIDGTQTLWIVFYCDELAYPCVAALYCNNPNSDWYSSNGTEWKHALDNDAMMSWIIRGYLEKPGNKATFVTNENKRELAASGYNVYRTNVFTGDITNIGNTTDTVYIDNSWGTQEAGKYQWGVAALYEGNSQESEIVWSKPIDKDMTTEVKVTARTNNGDSAKEATVTLANTVEEDYVYSAVLDHTGTVTFDSFRKGTYELTVEKEGFSSTIINQVVEIWDEADFNVLLTEVTSAVEGLYVSPTGYAMWDGKFIDTGDEFSYSFENGLEGWTTIDANADGHTWNHSSQADTHGTVVGTSHTGTGHIFSESFCLGSNEALLPDDYIVSPTKVSISNTSVFSFYASAIDEAYYAEHFGVAVSVDGNTSASDFKTIAEWTIDGGKRQTPWTKYEVNLSDYAGKEVWIAIRHFGIADMFVLTIDDVILTNANSERALIKYQVMLDGNVVADSLATPFFQHENLVDGTEYTTSVIAKYTSGSSEAVEYTWTKMPEETFLGVNDLSAKLIDNKAVLSWTLPDIDLPDPVSYSYSFENGMEGWTLIDNDGDGFNWTHNSYNADVLAHNGESCVYSESFNYEIQIALYPDNYMVAPKKFTATEESKISFYACAQHYNYPNEHIGVAVSSASNNNSDDFTTIAEWTIEGDKRQTEWVKYEADLSEYAGQEIWVAIRHFNVSDEYIVVVDDIEIFIDNDNDNDNDNEREVREENENAIAEILGVMIYRNGKLLSHKLTEGETFTDNNGVEGDEYCVKVVYGGDKDATYYAMSDLACAEVIYEMYCAAPKNLYGEYHSQGGDCGALLTWPYEDEKAWMYYDDGVQIDALGTGDSGSSFYWGVMFPAESLSEYVGRSLTMVSMFDCLYHGGTLYVFKGGTTSPGVLACSQPYIATGSGEFVKFELNRPVAIDGTENIWVVFRNDYGATYPAAYSAFSGDSNGSWISLDGSTWGDVASPDIFGAPLTWMVRAYAGFANKTTDYAQQIELVNINNEGTTLKAKNEVVTRRASTLDHYNIYRSTTADNFQLIGSSEEGTYFDAINEDGTYYYQVKAVYEENGETCESEAASVYNSDKDYVMVDIVSIDENGVKGMMIYPNPTKDKVMISAESIERITIIDAMGRAVADNIVNSDNETINMSQYDAGVYMIRIVTKSGVAVKRITVVR